MKYRAGAQRPASVGARPARLAHANDLVRHTLSQHGFLPRGGGTSAAGPRAAMPDPNALMAGLSLPRRGSPAPEPRLPEGAAFLHGSFSCAAGSRSHRIYVPSTAKARPTGLLLMLHGCTQTPEDFAVGTGMNALAETHRFVVVYPQQSRGENARCCWNWFQPGDQRRDLGEPAILAGMAREVVAAHDIPPHAICVAGFSAGAAMAVILGETYPDLFAAVGAHSGLPYAAASDLPSALQAMAGQGADREPGPGRAAAPTIIFHGAADTTVHPENADRIARRLRANGAAETIETEIAIEIGGRSLRHTVATTPAGRPVLEQWHVDGLSHAWSGGHPDGSHTDAVGPDASAEMIRFFRAAVSQGRQA